MIKTFRTLLAAALLGAAALPAAAADPAAHEREVRAASWFDTVRQHQGLREAVDFSALPFLFHEKVVTDYTTFLGRLQNEPRRPDGIWPRSDVLDVRTVAEVSAKYEHEADMTRRLGMAPDDVIVTIYHPEWGGSGTHYYVKTVDGVPKVVGFWS